MIEIYLFVNPIGPVCYQSETLLLESLKTLGKKVQLQILPLVNLQTVGLAMDYIALDKKDILLRNEQSKQIYSAALDYKAAQLQGKKVAREFLLKLQEQVGCNRESYSRELVETIFSETSGDLEMFLEDRQSDIVRKNFVADQEVARDMGIKMSPSAVVYNFGCDGEYGVLLEGRDALPNIIKLCQANKENDLFFHENKHLKKSCRQRFSPDNRHLVLL